VVDKNKSDNDETTKPDDAPHPMDSSETPGETDQDSAEPEQLEPTEDPDIPDTGPQDDAETRADATVQDNMPDENGKADPHVLPQQPRTKSGGFVPALLGGFVAAVLGFLAASSGVLDGVLPPSWRQPDPAEQIAALESRVADQSESLTALSGRVSGLKGPDLSPLERRITDLSARLDDATVSVEAIQTGLASIDKRLVALEKRPVTEGISQSAIDAYERELAGFQDALATQRAEVEDMIAQARAMDASAAEAARQAGIQAMIAMLRSALDDGSSFAAVVEKLKASGVTVPETLTGTADKGVTTLAALQAGFPVAARNALAVAHEANADGQSGLGGFLKRRLGARSVEPRDGDDPDAILSRAEANLKNGDLGSALDELSALPEPPAKAMQGWIAAAQQRHAAIEAASSIAADPATN